MHGVNSTPEMGSIGCEVGQAGSLQQYVDPAQIDQPVKGGQHGEVDSNAAGVHDKCRTVKCRTDTSYYRRRICAFYHSNKQHLTRHGVKLSGGECTKLLIATLGSWWYPGSRTSHKTMVTAHSLTGSSKPFDEIVN